MRQISSWTANIKECTHAGHSCGTAGIIGPTLNFCRMSVVKPADWMASQSSLRFWSLLARMFSSDGGASGMGAKRCQR